MRLQNTVALAAHVRFRNAAFEDVRSYIAEDLMAASSTEGDC